MPGMGAADMDRGLASMDCLPYDRDEQQEPGGDGLMVMIRIGEPDEQGPPVEHQRYEARYQPVALQILGYETAPRKPATPTTPQPIGTSPPPMHASNSSASA